MKKTILFLLTTVFSITALALTPQEILKKSDDKFIPDIFSYTLTIESTNDEGKMTKQVMDGNKKGTGKNVLVTKEPKRYSGNVSMRKESTIWLFFTSNKKIMKTAFQSLALGEVVSYGDILASELSFDYDVASMDETGSDYLFTLKPKKGHEGYAKLIVTIDKTSLLPKKREYYALSGVMLKISEFEKFEFNDKGKVVYVKQKYFDPIKNRNNFVTIENIKELSDVPEKYFNESYLQYIGAK
jgi:hypothetical protein